MKLIAYLLFLTSLSVFANNPSQNEETNVFNSGLFGEEKSSSQMQSEEAEKAPTWVTPSTTPEKQAEEEAPVERVNQWQDQSDEAAKGVTP